MKIIIRFWKTREEQRGENESGESIWRKWPERMPGWMNTRDRESDRRIWNAKYTLSGLSDRKDRPTGRRKRKKERREGEKKKNAITRRDIAGRSQPVTTDGYIKATVEKSVQRLHACILLYPRCGGGRRYIRLLPGRRRRWRRRNEPVALKEEGISGLARRGRAEEEMPGQQQSYLTV